MPVKKVPAASSSILDVLERVLDRGIVIDAWVGVSLAGIRLLELDTRIIVASLDTYLRRGQELSLVVGANRPAVAGAHRPELKVVSATVSADPEPAIAPLPPRRRQRRRKLTPQPAATALPTLRLRCDKGCGFEWTKTDDPPPASMACPYRKRTRCRVAPA
jgi:gas vesicle structural protein